jgi:putative peptidoglycan lipid II flippase
VTIPSPTSANRQIARAAGTVMAAILLGQLTGLLRGIVVARAFPADLLDAFLVANRVSETLFNLIAGGALGSAFIPTFTGFLTTNDQDSAWRLASGVANLLTLTLSLLAVIAAWFAPQIIRYALAPGLFHDFVLFNLTIGLMRIQLVSAVLFGLGGLVVGILNAHQVFLIPALTPSMYQIGLIFGTLVLSRWMGIYGLAWGVVIGAGLYLFVQIPSLLKVISANSAVRQYAIRITFSGFKDPNVFKVLRLMGPRLLGVAVVQVNFWVNNWLASQMSEGSVTGLYYGFALMLMAQAAIAQSVAIAAMPTFSAQFALGKIDEMRNALATALRGMLLLAIPASVGLIMLREPIVSMLYERGEFTAETTELVAWALLWFGVGLVGHSIMEVLTRAFYAQHDTKTPVLVGTAAMGLNVVFSFAFSAWFTRLGWMPHGGLALANSLATGLEAAALSVLMRRRLKGMDAEIIATGFGKSAMAALGMALALMVWVQAEVSPNRWVVGLGGVAIGGLVYGLSVWVLKVPELKMVINAMKRKVKRKK